MLIGGFETILDEGSPTGTQYIDGYILPVPTEKKEAYRKMAAEVTVLFMEFGALRAVESWGDDVPDGKLTDYNRASLKEPHESVVYSWVEWPDKATRDGGWARMMEDERMQFRDDPVFDGKRMMWGGFVPLIDTAKG
nr:DUF1428 domain-containing protein [Sphingomonas soli]